MTSIGERLIEPSLYDTTRQLSLRDLTLRQLTDTRFEVQLS